MLRNMLLLGLGAIPAVAQPYEIAVTKDAMIVMRDGVKLAANVYRPARNGAAANGVFPVLLERTPYGKDRTGGMKDAEYFVPRGYVVMVQDVRGRYHSEGRWRPIVDDAKDGLETAKWIVAQPWSDGNIGTFGFSYSAATQHAMAISRAPGLKTMIPVDAMSNFGRYGVRHNGAFELRWLNWVFTLGNSTVTQNAREAAARANPGAVPQLLDLGTNVRDFILGLPLRPGTTPLKYAPDYEAWLLEAMRHGDYDLFWQGHGASVIDHVPEYKDIPIVHVTGWYDSWSGPVANLTYPALHKSKKNPQRLVIGPWTHGAQESAFAGEAEFTPDAALDFNAWRERWFDRWLKNKDNGIEREAPVKIYVMGGGDARRTPAGRIFVGGHWRDEQEWPLARTKPTPYYLHADGKLSTQKPGDAKPLTYSFDPKKPVPTLGGNISSQGNLMAIGAADQRCRKDFWLCSDDRPLSARNDVLVFQTPPLTANMEVTGRLIVKLWASTDGPDTDFTAKLIDVYPPNGYFPAGVDLNVGDSIVRGRYRNASDKAEMLKAGQPYEFTIEMYPTSLVFQKGHRIRVDISSSNFPRFDVNPNTGEPLNENRRWRIAENSIYVDGAHASHMVLPVIPK
jgi:putative CocE/NonD family hydrolase